MTRDSLAHETGLTEKQVKLALRKLQSRGIVERLGRGELLRPTHPKIARGSQGMKVWAGLVRMAGNAAGGMILSQLHYWTSDDSSGHTRLRVHRNGFWWLAKACKEFGEETGLKTRQVRSAVDLLRRQGIIHKEAHLFRGLVTLHLRFDDDGFDHQWEEQEIARLERLAERR